MTAPETARSDSPVEYGAAVAEARRQLGAWSGRPPARRWGRNFMTPDIVLHACAADGAWAEVSTGTMPVFGARPRRTERIWGVTFLHPHDDRSQLCHSLAEVRAVLGYDEGDE